MPQPIAVEFTDLHIEDDTADVCIDIALQAMELAKSLGVKTVINAGDTLNARKSQTLNSLMAVNRILNIYEENEILMLAIDGNHDKLMYNSENSYMDAFSRHPALALVKTGVHGIISLPTIDISMVSFFSDNNQCTSNEIYADHVRAVNKEAGKHKNKKQLLITHHGFDGAKTNSGVPVSSDLTAKLVSNFDEVHIGHYHDNSTIGRLKYVGSCRQAWFTENKHKGFTIIYDDMSTKHVKSKYKEYTEIDVTLSDDYTKKIDAAVKLLNTKHPNDYKRLHLIGDKASSKSVRDLLPGIKAMGIDVRETNSTDSVHEGTEDHTNFEYIKFNEDDVAGLFMEFGEEEGLSEAEMEYGVELLGRTISKNKYNGKGTGK